MVSALTNDAGYLVMGDLTNFVTKNTAQTISGLKTFTGDIVLSGTTSIKNTTDGTTYSLLWRDASGVQVGASTQALNFAGTNTRPTYNSNNMALFSDIPTVVSALTNDAGYLTAVALSGLTDVAISSLADGQSLIYDANAGKWKNVSSSVSVGFAAITGSPDDNVALKAVLDSKSGCILRRW